MDRMTQSIHVAEVFPGVDTETDCPCEKAACGFVDISNTSPECTTHTRRGIYARRHIAGRCPGTPTPPSEGDNPT
jgi:hypothetical protein